MRLNKYLDNFLFILMGISFIGMVFSKTFIGQIVLGISAFLILLVGNLKFIIEKNVVAKYIVATNIVYLLLIAMVISNVYFKRDDITLGIIITSFILVFGFIIVELIRNNKN